MAGAPQPSRGSPYRYVVAAILLCGPVLALFVWREVRKAEDRGIEAEFVRRATVRHALTREILGRYEESLYALTALLTSNANLSHDDFARASARLQQRLPGSRAFEWVPYVRQEDRAAFEAAMVNLYEKRGFALIEFDANGHARRAPDRPYHYPISYIEPLRGNEIAVGYDLVGGPTITFLERARLTRQMIVTRPIRLIQEPNDQFGIVMIWPVYRTSTPGRPEEETSAGGNTSGEVFAGFFQCVFRIRDLLDTVAGTQADPTLDSLFVDASGPDLKTRVLFYDDPSPPYSTPSTPSEEEFRRGARMTFEQVLPEGGREWKVIYRPKPEWIAAQHSAAPYIRGASVLICAGLLSGLVLVIGRRTETIKREVELRTAELAESRRQFSNLVHALPGLAYRGTYETSLSIQFASEGALALTGWSADEIERGDVDIRTLIHPDDITRVRTETKAALQARKDIQVEYRIRARDGTEKWVLSRGRGVYSADGKLVAIEGIVIDISDARRAESARMAIERKLLETQKLESLGLLAGGIAHDFNNLLSAILGNASLARMTLPTGTGADPHLRAIETASLRAAELCRQMLAYAGKGRFVVERVDLSAMVHDLLPLLRVSIARSAVLQLELAPSLPGVRADATQLRQIVMNLVLNAVDALGGNPGEITLRTAYKRVDRQFLADCVTGHNLPLGDYVMLEVRDTGCGMAPDVAARIFEPFFTTKFAGRGLGLAAVLGIVRGHNGALRVESKVNQGSTFQLLLPTIVTDPVPPPETIVSPTKTEWRQSGDALVIEDEEPVRIVMVELLKTFGFDAHAVADGRSGVAAFQENASRWSLVIIDLIMPGMSGEQTLGALRAINPGVRVLLVSGYAEGEIMKRVGASGRVAFLPKPFNRDVFEAKLRELFGAK